MKTLPVPSLKAAFSLASENIRKLGLLYTKIIICGLGAFNCYENYTEGDYLISSINGIVALGSGIATYNKIKKYWFPRT